MCILQITILIINTKGSQCEYILFMDRRLAYNEYQNSKEKARFLVLAQKLAQQFNNHSEDKNSRIRWIWELIQNAKDAPNQFGKCRIKIEIMEDKLIFAHNGDPFRVSDLESLVGQYSSKAQENKINSETTGKYGTGFIVTHILSKKVRIKGLITMKTQQEMKVNTQRQLELNDNVELVSEEEIVNSRFKNQTKTSQKKLQIAREDFNQSINIEDDLEVLTPLDKQMKKFEGGSLYQKFQTFLDREYTDRDTQLVHKLMNTEKNLMEDLLKNIPEPKWQRKQTELNTRFVYQNLDGEAFKMIEQAIASLKELFPYALLFNQKLFSIQVIDKREGKKIKNFGIKKIDQDRYNGINIFNASILQEPNRTPRKFSLAYATEEETNSTVAIPLEFYQNGIKLLEVNRKHPKIFKEFPLIGCKDHGFNFVFTSKMFYPNESRSDLLLKQIEGRNSKKSKRNWQAIQAVFPIALQLQKAISKMITEGQQNLLTLSLKNQFTDQQFQKMNMVNIFQQFRRQISLAKFIELKNQRMGSLSDLVFLMGESENKKVQNSQYSFQLNSIFSQVIGQERTINDFWYDKFYPKLNSNMQTWQKIIQIRDIKYCMKKISQLRFAQFVYKTEGSKQLALQLLHRIYQFLNKYNPFYVTQRKDKHNNQQQYAKFVLTNKGQFKDLTEDSLMVKQNLPPAYQEIALYLSLDINQFTIHDNFGQYFLKTSKLGIEQMLQKFRSIFYINLYDIEVYLLRLGRFLATFNVKTEIMQIAQKFKNLSNINTPFMLTDQKNKPVLSQKMYQQYKYLFERKVMNYISTLIDKNESLSKLMHSTIFISQQRALAINWLNSIFKLEAELLQLQNRPEFRKITQLCKGLCYNGGFEYKHIISKNLSMSGRFVNQDSLKYFCFEQDQRLYKGNYPDNADIQFYNRIISLIPRNGNLLGNIGLFGFNQRIVDLRDTILHESIQYKLPKPISYKEAFKFMIQFYSNGYKYENTQIFMSNQEKIAFFYYIFRLRQSAKQNRELQFKIQVFKQIEDIAHYEYPRLTNCIIERQNKIYAFSLIRDQTQLSAARQITQQFGGLKSVLEQLRAMRNKQIDRQRKE